MRLKRRSECARVCTHARGGDSKFKAQLKYCPRWARRRVVRVFHCILALFDELQMVCMCRVLGMGVKDLFITLGRGSKATFTCSLNSVRRKPANNKNEPFFFAAEAFDIRNAKMANAHKFILDKCWS